MTTAQVVRAEIEKVHHMLELDMEDFAKRIKQGCPADLTAVAARSIMGQAMQLIELTSELKGLETGAEEGKT